MNAQTDHADAPAAGDDSLDVLNARAADAARAGDLVRALEIALQAEELARHTGNMRGLARSIATRAMCAYLRADYPDAHAQSLESGSLAERSGDRQGLADTLLLAAACQYQMGALTESHTALMQVLHLIREEPDQPNDEAAFRAHNMLGMIHSERDEFDAAEQQFELALAAGTRIRSEFYLQRVRVNRAGLYRKLGVALRLDGRESDAIERFRAGAAVCEEIRADAAGFASRENAGGCAGVLGEIYLQLGRPQQALELFAEMHEIGARMDNVLLQAEAMLHVGRYHLERSEPGIAVKSLDRSLELATRANARRLEVEIHEALACARERQGDLPDALRLYKRFHELSEALLRAELSTLSEVRSLWLEFQQARREAHAYRERFESLARDNEELARRATGLVRAASEDALTGLHNRRYLDLRLEELIGSLHGKGGRLAVAMLDIDHFKSINDQLTHRGGDEVLRAIATMIRTHCREGDVSARFGGDEFVICLIGNSLQAAELTLERLRSFVESHDWESLHPGLSVRVSIGIAELREGDHSSTLLARADAALYRAKQAGRNRIWLG